MYFTILPGGASVLSICSWKANPMDPFLVSIYVTITLWSDVFILLHWLEYLYTYYHAVIVDPYDLKRRCFWWITNRSGCLWYLLANYQNAAKQQLCATQKFNPLFLSFWSTFLWLFQTQFFKSKRRLKQIMLHTNHAWTLLKTTAKPNKSQCCHQLLTHGH